MTAPDRATRVLERIAWIWAKAMAVLILVMLLGLAVGAAAAIWRLAWSAAGGCP